MEISTIVVLLDEYPIPASGISELNVPSVSLLLSRVAYLEMLDRVISSYSTPRMVPVSPAVALMRIPD